MTKAKRARVARKGSAGAPANGLGQIKAGMILGLGLIVATALVTVIVRSSLPTKLTDTDRSLLQLYQGIRVPLTNDDLQGAKVAASALLNRFPSEHDFSEAARAINGCDSLERARTAFKGMSAVAVRLAKGHKEYRIAGCAMDLCPAACAPCQMYKFGDWVQTDTPITNPFMGKASPSCGVLKN